MFEAHHIFSIESGSQDFYHDTTYTNSIPDTYFTDGTHDMGTRVVDINGDGKSDLLQLFFPIGANLGYYNNEPQRRVYLSSGSNYVYDSNYSNSLPDTYFTDGVKDMGSRIADINGDGLPDLIQLYHNTTSFYDGQHQRKVFLNTGTGFVHDINYSNSLPDAYFTDGSSDLGTRIADLNGDGLADLVQIYLSSSNRYSGIPQRRVYLNDGDTFNYDTTFSNSLSDTYFTNGSKDMGTRIADINRDGLADLIQLYLPDAVHYSGVPQRRVYLNNGVSFSQDSDYSNSLSDSYFSDGSSDMGTRIADVNADGYADLVQLYYSPSNHYGGNPQRRVFVNNGDSFALDVGYSNSLPDAYFTDGSLDMGTQLGDLNGDGLVDLIQIYSPTGAHYGGNSTRRAFINTGRGFDYNATHSNSIQDTYFTDGSLDMGTRLADISGDGAVDLIQIYLSVNGYYGTNHVREAYLKNSVSHRVNHIVKNALIDGNIDIEYEPLSLSDNYQRTQIGSYPVAVYQGPMPVVTAYEVDDGLGGKHRNTYYYEDLKMHVAGYGSLGFRKITVTDPFNFQTVTSYSQDWQNRTTGLIEQEWQTAPNGTVIKTSVNAFDTHVNQHVHFFAYRGHRFSPSVDTQFCEA